MEVYLDNAATSRRKPEQVYRAMDRFMRDIGASPSRSVHAPGIAAGRLVAETRNKFAKLVGITDPSRIVFTLNCTEALNLAIKGILQPQDHVVTSSLEHNSVMRPLLALVQQRNVTISQAKVNPEGITDPEDLARKLRPETKLIIITHASNVTGAIQPVETIGQIARQHQIPLLLDAAQTIGCLPIDLNCLPVDMMAFSGHKSLMGPQGVGGLYIKEGIDLISLKQGGTGSASSEQVQPEYLPDKFESGTPNTPGIAGLSAALDFITSVTIEKIRNKIYRLGLKILEKLQNIEAITLYGPKKMEQNIGIFSFNIKGQDPAFVAQELENRYHIMTRVGLHCSPSTHHVLGTFPHGSIRAAIGYLTTDKEIEHFTGSLEEKISPPDERCIIIFPSTHFAVRAERAAQKAGISVRMIPVPRRISPDCNMGMETTLDQRDNLVGIMSNTGIECDFITSTD